MKVSTTESHLATGLAAVFCGPGSPFELRRLPLPELREGEILTRVSCCTICGSDLHTVEGRRKEATPSILGHEIVGVVEDIRGGPVRDLRGSVVQRGDRLVWCVIRSCHSCRNCRRGFPQKCESAAKFGHHPCDDQWPFSGGLAEYCHLPRGTSLLKVPAAISDTVVSPASCATATATAALRNAGPMEDQHVLILGAGLIGLTTAALAASHGAQTITICDPAAARLKIAESFGVDHAISFDELADKSRSSRPGHGPDRFDVVFEMSGSPQAIEIGIALAGIGGRVILVGSVLPTRPVPLSPEDVVRRLLRIVGVHNYLPHDLIAAIDFLANGGQHFPFGELVPQTFRLRDVEKAFQYANTTRPIRVAVQP